MTTNLKYYLIETETVGPADNWTHTVEIDNWPASFYGKVYLDGFVHELDGIATRAHGVYNTLEAAREAIKDKWMVSIVPQDPWGDLKNETYTIRRERKTPRRK